MHAIDSGCPVCKGGLKPTNIEPSEDAHDRFREAMAVRAAVAEAQAVQEAAEAYFLAWDEQRWRETEEFLRALPEAA